MVYCNGIGVGDWGGGEHCPSPQFQYIRANIKMIRALKLGEDLF